MSAEPEPRQPWWLVCADWLHAGEEYRLRTQDALDGLDCVYCGDSAQTLDHVIPRSQGGGDEAENLVPACRACNASKAGQSLDAWIANLSKYIANGARAQRRLDGARWVRQRVGRS